MFTFWESPVSFVCLVRPYSQKNSLQIPFLFGSLRPISTSIGTKLMIALTRFRIGSRLGGSPDVLRVVTVLPLGVLSLPHPLCNHPLAVQLVQNHHPEKWKFRLEVNISDLIAVKASGKKRKITNRRGAGVGRWLCFCSKTQIPKFTFVQNNKFQSIICGIVHSLKQQTPESPHPPLALSPCSRKMSTTVNMLPFVQKQWFVHDFQK